MNSLVYYLAGTTALAASTLYAYASGASQAWMVLFALTVLAFWVSAARARALIFGS